MRTLSVITIFLALILMAPLCVAQNTPPSAAQAKAPRANKKTSINFEDQLIQGEVKKPELFYLLQKKQFNFGRLIKLRENFVPEMRRTAEEIQRGGN